MRRFTVVCLLPLLLLGCTRRFSTSPELTPVRPLTQEEQELAARTNRFGLKLFQQIVRAEAPEANVFCSPYSVAAALAMTANGAAGETEQAMWSSLGYGGLSTEQADQAFQSLTELLLSLDPKVQLEIANSIWYRQGLHVRNEFVRLVRSYFGAPVQALDFSAPGAVDAVNNWASDRTHGRIRRVLDRIDPQDVMFLANAIYFKGLWQYRFDEAKTQEDRFYLPDGSTVACQMMVQTVDELPFATGDGFRAVDLPYGSGLLSMTILLPDEGLSADSLLSRLTAEDLDALFAAFAPRKVTVWLPKFRIRYGRELSPELKQLGMAIAFDPQRANFSRLFEEQLQIYIGFVIHKAFVQVDEAGTEAAAVTVVGMRAVSTGQQDEVMYFRVDRPFLFLIRDRHSNTILFAGKIADPKWEE